jgi:voltage-gated potassium channel
MPPPPRPAGRKSAVFRDPDATYDVADPRGLPLRERIDWILEEPASVAGRVVELVVGALIVVACTIVVVLSFDLEPDTRRLLGAIETGITVLFLVEYLVRWWADRFSWRYPLTPLALIDLVAILPLFLGPHLQLIRVLRLFRVLRLLRLVQSRRFFFGEVTPEHLIVLRILFTVFCLVFVTGGLVYELEHRSDPETWKTAFDGLYFAVVTLSTVGFGDMTPQTVAGRWVTMLMILVGVLVLPWQVTTLARRVLFERDKVRVVCPQCGLSRHDPDASHCKSCGQVIYQEYAGG